MVHPSVFSVFETKKQDAESLHPEKMPMAHRKTGAESIGRGSHEISANRTTKLGPPPLSCACFQVLLAETVLHAFPPFL
ncbi:MAG: hypothetical protein ACI4PD_05760 [Butyricicoccus sp.]